MYMVMKYELWDLYFIFPNQTIDRIMTTTRTTAKSMRFIIGASSVGTLIEWYDFYIFGMLAPIIARQFFPSDAGTSALLSTLAIFAAGFIVRPFGALVFGRLGDRIGRKHTFLLTLILMGGSTFAIGLVPGYASVGWLSPILVLLLRLVQGLALGGEYGGAATYVAEHAPANRRGYWTSWIQTTATLGLFLALGVILLIREAQGVAQFTAPWGGWRYPFWTSLLLVLVSILIRLRMQESPMFSRVKETGTLSKNPLKESFGRRANFKWVLLALFGAVMGQGVVWYTGQFYAQSFIENICNLSFTQSRNIMLVAILLATPFFVVFGALSDRVGRKWIMLLGMLLAVVSYYSIYSSLLHTTAIDTRRHLLLSDLSVTRPATVLSDPQTPNKILLVQSSDSVYSDGAVFRFTRTDSIELTASRPVGSGKLGLIRTGEQGSRDTVIATMPGVEQALPGIAYVEVKPAPAVFKRSVEKTMGTGDFWWMVFLVWVQVIFVTMVYGPIAAFLVELFPTRIRYTSMSLPYHIGNGVFGGLVPFLSTLIVSLTQSPAHPDGNPLAGLWYPIGVAALCVVIGAVYLRNAPTTKDL
jgi:MFS family permease